MINNRQQTGRRRGRGGQQRPGGGSGGGGGGGGGRLPEMGNRIDSRARGNAAQLLEKYKTLARDAQQAGDRVLAEYYLQFADHYFRVLAESRARFDEANPRRQGSDAESNDSYDDEDGEGEDGDDEFAPPRQQQVRPRDDRPQQRDDRPRYEGPRNEGPRNEGPRNEGPRNEGQRNERPQQVARDDRPQRENRPQRDEGMRDERPRQQPREDRPREDGPRVDRGGETRVESEVAEIYRDESAAQAERPVREERPTRDGTRRRLGMHSSANGSASPVLPPVDAAPADDGHDDDHLLPLDVLPPSISATVSAALAAVEEATPAQAQEPQEPQEGEPVAPAPRRRGRPRKIVPETAAEG